MRPARPRRRDRTGRRPGRAGRPRARHRTGRRARGPATSSPLEDRSAHVASCHGQNGGGAPLRAVPRPPLRPGRRPRRRRSPRPTTCCPTPTSTRSAARDARNIVHVDVPRGGDDRYEQAGAAAAVVARRRRDGRATTSRRSRSTACGSPTTPARARDLVGVLGGLEVVDEGAGGVLPHERTTPKASTDRLDLTRATDANLSPVWGLSLATGLTALLAEPGEPVGAVTVDGVEHVVERVTDPDRVAAIRDHLGRDDVLIADGHHRYGVARMLPRRGAGGDRSHRHAGRADAGVRRRAGRRAAQHRGHPPAVHRDRRSPTCAPPSAACFDLSPADRVRRRRRWPTMEARRPPRARRTRRRRVADARRPVRSTASAPSTARGSSTPSPATRRRGHLPARPRRGRSPPSTPATPSPPC